jgi:hypothetical protein
MIFYLPIEPYKMRYTTELDKQIVDYLCDHGIPHVRIADEQSVDRGLPEGMFLDAARTIQFKAYQLSELAKYVHDGIVQDGDTIFVSDLWFPGLESIAYLKYFYKKNVKIRGLFHAGSMTDTDHVRNMERWAKNFEDIIFDIVDEVFVGSIFISEDICRKRMVDDRKIKAIGFPLSDEVTKKQFLIPSKKRSPIVVFNGRLDDEKQPWLFDELQKRLKKKYFTLPHLEFYNTQKLRMDKKYYYELLSKAKVVVSFAKQENFGFGINEAVALGCIPILPNRLVYPEFYGKEYLYTTFEECVDMVADALLDNLDVPPSPVPDKETIFATWFHV